LLHHPVASLERWLINLTYVGLTSTLVRDDLVLMNWLRTFDPEKNAEQAAAAKAVKKE
jgi:hypothetical protein